MFLHSFEPSRIAFSLGSVNAYYYGLLIAVGMISGLAVSLWVAEKCRIKKDHVWNLFFYFAVFGLIGARIFYVLAYGWEYYWRNPLAVFRIWEGGLSIHGGIIAGLLVLLFYCRKNKDAGFWLLADILAPALALAQAIGRWGNYFNQELFGFPTDLPWGIPICLAKRPLGFAGFGFFHPTFLYESLWDLLMFAVLAFGLTKAFGLKNKGKNYKSGSIFLAYLALYSVARFLMEFLRIDEQPLILGMRTGQLISIAVFLAAATAYLFRKSDYSIKK